MSSLTIVVLQEVLADAVGDVLLLREKPQVRFICLYELFLIVYMFMQHGFV